MTNELVVNVDTETGEILNQEIVVQETNEYKIVKLADGTFKKNTKYRQIFTRTAETEEEKFTLYKVFNDSDSGLVTPLKNMVDKEISVAHYFTQPYESFNEKTGEVTNGVTTTIEDTEGNYYATSSKSVYHTLLSICNTFGSPSDDQYKPLKLKVTGTKRQNGIQIDLQLIGRA